MINWLFIVVIVVFFFSVYSGHKKGVFKTLFSVISIIIAVILTTIITPYVAKQINKNEKINKSVRESVGGVIDIVGENKNDEEQEAFIDSLPVSEYVKKYLRANNNLQVYQDRGINSFNEYIVDGIVRLVINLITYAVLFFFIRIVVFVLSIVSNLLSMLPIMEESEGYGGWLIGSVKGILEVWVLFIVITIVAHTDYGMNAMNCINSNGLLGQLYNNNIILEIMYQFI